MIKQKRNEFSVFVLIAAACWLMGYSVVMTERTAETARAVQKHPPFRAPEIVLCYTETV